MIMDSKYTIKELETLLEDYSKELDSKNDEYYSSDKELTIDFVTKFLKHIDNLELSKK